MLGLEVLQRELDRSSNGVGVPVNMIMNHAEDQVNPEIFGPQRNQLGWDLSARVRSCSKGAVHGLLVGSLDCANASHCAADGVFRSSGCDLSCSKGV